jgi:acyl-CoA reductase-like NAD-dependent aldehyde dehydrogenase
LSDLIARPKGSVLDAFQVALLDSLKPYMERVEFAAGDVLIQRGTASEAFYVIEEGDVVIEVHSDEMDTDGVLDYAGPGSFLGEVGFLAGGMNDTTARALTPVSADRISTQGIRRLFKENPQDGVHIMRALARDTAGKLNRVNRRMGEHIADDARDPEADEMVAAAVAAQRELETWPEDRVDALLGAMAQAVADHAQELAEQTVQETTLGNVPDKVIKITFASLGVFGAMQGKPGYGEISRDEEHKLVEMANPVGVILGLVPVTNPVPTFINKALIALKARNAIILSCHRSSQGVANSVGELVQNVLAEHGAPPALVQWIRNRTSRRKTAKFMEHENVAMILATGGQAMVRAAYSSGKPAIGVGAGNAPAWIAPDADLEVAAQQVIQSKAFDNGLICGSEQHLVVDASVRAEFVAALERGGAAVLDAEETARFVAEAFEPGGDLRMHFVGRAAGLIAEHTGIERAKDARLLVFEADASRPEGAQARERLAPLLSLFTVSGDDEAIGLCRQLLFYEGAGHSANIHTQSQERIDRFAAAMPASRVMVNVPSALGCCGFATGLVPSLTLGCGTYGGNSTTDNVSYRNLMNIKRLAYSTIPAGA